MRPYIMNYSESMKLGRSHRLPASLEGLQDSTVISESIEADDKDELSMCSTMITRSTEPDDTDDIQSASTLITHTVEPSDTDELTCASTWITKSLEPTYEDEILRCALMPLPAR